MSDPRYPAPPQEVRPASVTISSYLLFLVAALQAIGLVLAISVLGRTMEVYEEAFAGTEMADQAGLVATVGLVVGVGFGLLLAIGLVVLAVLNNRGKNPARIVTWVLGGLFLCCLGGGLTISAAGNALDFGPGGAGNGPDQAEVERMLEDRLPSWYVPADLTIDILAFVALLVALILLALPSANRFFRNPQTVWEPPVPGSTYPGYPPAAPGYPPAGPPSPPSPPAPPAG